MTSESTTKKQLQRLQRAIVDGLEDVKGQDIVVFNTEELSPLFERVIVASGTSNRQTRALASSVCDAVRDAGFAKPRVEGEDNGEWIIVDCGQVVAHVMQPVIRQYYRLEEIWGAKPVRLRHGAEKVKASPEDKELAAPVRKPRTAARTPAVPAKPAKPAKPSRAAPRAAASAEAPAGPKRAATPRAAAKTGAGAAPAKRRAAAPGAKAPMAKLVVNKPRADAKPAARKSGTRQAAAKKSAS
ncbi:MAG: ribosome silencing factor [Burkholderiaceae bacterium]